MTRSQARALWFSTALMVAVLAIVASGGCSDPPQPVNVVPPDDNKLDPDDTVQTEPGCPNDLPDCGDDAAPSYSATIRPIVSTRCMPCHGDGGFAADKHNFSAYEGLDHERLSTLLHEVYHCAMPPPDADTISSEQRAALLKWIVCHTPNN